MTDTTEHRSTAWQTALTMLQEIEPPYVPEGFHVMTVDIEYPAGDPGAPPHRHSGPAFGYVVAGEMLFELEGEPPRVIKAGEAFWEPGGDIIHYQDGNNRSDIPLKFTVTMLCAPHQEMFTLVPEAELTQRANRHAHP
ncbi:cupin domain-containing protein [Kribbella sp. NPDC050459]|uniref:cupin domain-containing protein n=1 Tax=Kribbella sp. NPDC050459 TaxID=3155785 RepID=UPI0033EE7F51